LARGRCIIHRSYYGSNANEYQIKDIKKNKKKTKWKIESLKMNNIPFQRSIEEAVGTITRKGMDVNAM